VFGGLSKAARNQIRDIIREEMRKELDLHLNPTFIELVRKGTADMERIFDAVIAADEKHDALIAEMRILHAAVEDLQKRVPR
jgi:hypothetical protein